MGYGGTGLSAPSARAVIGSGHLPHGKRTSGSADLEAHVPHDVPRPEEIADLLGLAIAILAEDINALGASIAPKDKSRRRALARKIEALARDAHSLALAREVLERREIVF